MEQKIHVVDVDERTGKEKLNSFLYETKRKAKIAFDWVKQNPKEAVILASSGMALLSSIIGQVGKAARLGEEKRLKDCKFYDRSAGVYAESRRKLTNDELSELVLRHQLTKDPYTVILQDMGLSK